MLILSKSWGDKSAGNVLADKHDSLSLIPTTHEKSQAWLHLFVITELGDEVKQVPGSHWSA